MWDFKQSTSDWQSLPAMNDHLSMLVTTVLLPFIFIFYYFMCWEAFNHVHEYALINMIIVIIIHQLLVVGVAPTRGPAQLQTTSPLQLVVGVAPGHGPAQLRTTSPLQLVVATRLEHVVHREGSGARVLSSRPRNHHGVGVDGVGILWSQHRWVGIGGAGVLWSWHSEVRIDGVRRVWLQCEVGVVCAG